MSKDEKVVRWDSFRDKIDPTKPEKKRKYQSKIAYVNGKRVVISRIVAKDELGRDLLIGEVVHHKDEDPTNNDPDNLEVFSSNGEHLAYHNRKRAMNKFRKLMKKALSKLPED